MTKFFRLLKIVLILMRYTFDRRFISKRFRFLRKLSYLNPLSFSKKNQSRGESLCMTLESLGPIYVKFGQLLSTREDWIPSDIALALQKLQDQVAPFDGEIAVDLVETTFQKPISDLFHSFEKKPLASASVAQVHAAVLKTGESVIVKIIRPGIQKIIRRDIALLKWMATCVERFWRQGKRARLVELVLEFEKTIWHELDLMREAANATQLKRNFEHSTMMAVPTIYWEWTREHVMTMERVVGIPISDIEKLRATNVHFKKLAENGVDIFFTQVFRDAFFHADMHPGNLFVDARDPDNPVYVGVDFGIMGTLSTQDQYYLASNMLAFLSRDYRRIAELHVASGWVSPKTRADEFEVAIRTVCEPIFQKSFSDIYFGQLLLKLFQTAERFQMTVQPQLFLLQKTLFYIESLGKKLYPELDLWQTAKPLLTRWMRKQYRLPRLTQAAFQDWRSNTERLLKMPNLAFTVLQQIRENQLLYAPESVRHHIQNHTKKRYFFLGVGLACMACAAAVFGYFHYFSLLSFLPGLAALLVSVLA